MTNLKKLLEPVVPSLWTFSREFKEKVIDKTFRVFDINPNVSDSDEKTEITLELPKSIKNHNVTAIFKDSTLVVNVLRNTVNKKQNSRKSFSYCYSYKPQNAENKKNLEIKFDNNIATIVLT